MTRYLSAVPAYGRDYRSDEAVLLDWMDGKDFWVMDVQFSGYVNRDDLPADTILNIRYDRQTEVLPVNRAGAVPVEDGDDEYPD